MHSPPFPELSLIKAEPRPGKINVSCFVAQIFMFTLEQLPEQSNPTAQLNRQPQALKSLGKGFYLIYG